LLRKKKFRDEIRHYDTAFQIAVLGSTFDNQHTKMARDGIITHTEFPYYIRVHGQLYHLMPPAVAEDGAQNKFIQLYTIDNALEELLKHKENANLDEKIVKQLLEYIERENPWAIAIKHTVKEYMENKPSVKEVVLEFVPHDGKQYRVPHQPTGRYYGSDCVRSPISFYRGPGEPPYESDEDLVELPESARKMATVL